MGIKKIVSGLLAAGMLACCAAAPRALPLSALVIEAHAATAPDKPEGLTAASTEAGKAYLKWNKVKGADGIEVYFSSSKDGDYKKARTLEGNKTALSVSGLKQGKTYYFKIRAFSGSGNKKANSKYSAVKKVKVLTEKEEKLISLKEKAPLLGSYFELLVNGYPLTTDIEFTSKGNYPYKINADFGQYGTCNRIRVTISDEDKFAARYFLNDGSTITLFVKNNEMTVLQSSTQLAVKKTLSASEKKDILNDLLSIKNTPVPDDFKGIKVKSSTKTINGKEYLYEKFYVAKADDYKIETYADKKTKELKNITINLGDSSMVFKIRAFNTDVDDSLFKIPGNYNVVQL